MKYVITKDNVILKVISEAKKDFAENYNIAVLVEDNEGNRFYLYKEDLKGSRQADTIEELCDEFVLVRKNVSNERMRFYQCLYSRLSDVHFDAGPNDKVYGAIWTEKGLIYVAQVNEEGKVCLL